jgi:hypothetical protein
MHVRRGVLAGVLVGTLLQAGPALAAPPPNDAFAAPQPLSGTAASVPGTTVEATLETMAGEPSHFTSGNGSVWYSWTAPADLILRLDTCVGSPGPARVQLYTGSSFASLVEVERRSDTPNCPGTGGGDLKRFNVFAGITYRISVIEYNGFKESNFTLGLEATPTPANDNFAAAQDLGQALNVDVDGTTVGTTLEPGEPNQFGGPGDGDSVWYRWTAPKRMRVWFDNCDAASDSEVTVYTGTSVASVGEVGPNYAEPAPPPCEGSGLYGRRDEFLAKAGTTYMIRVYTDLYAEGAFHLRMREIRFDASLRQTASATKIKKGKTVTYTVDITNLGTVPVDPTIDLLTSKPGHLAKPVVGTKYLSLDTTNGKCKTVNFFAKHPGAICDIQLDPGQSARIVAKVKPSESLDHYAELDYAHGADSPIFDEDGSNEDGPLTTVVKRKRKHR